MTGADLEDYQRFLSTSLPNPGTRHRARSGVRKFWLWRSSLPSGGLRFDPLHVDGWSMPNARGSENATARIPEEVLGPLFVWAMRFIDDFSADILAADRHWRTPLTAWPDLTPTANCPSSCEPGSGNASRRAGRCPPGEARPAPPRSPCELGRDRISVGRYRHLIDEAAAIAGTAPQTVSDQPVLGRLDGQPWIEAILADHTEPDSLAGWPGSFRMPATLSWPSSQAPGTASSSTCSGTA